MGAGKGAEKIEDAKVQAIKMFFDDRGDMRNVVSPAQQEMQTLKPPGGADHWESLEAIANHILSSTGLPGRPEVMALKTGIDKLARQVHNMQQDTQSVLSLMEDKVLAEEGLEQLDPTLLALAPLFERGGPGGGGGARRGVAVRRCSERRRTRRLGAAAVRWSDRAWPGRTSASC